MTSMTIFKTIPINLNIHRITFKNNLENKFIQVPRNIYFKGVPKVIFWNEKKMLYIKQPEQETQKQHVQLRNGF